RDQLGDLGAEVEDEDLVVWHDVSKLNWLLALTGRAPMAINNIARGRPMACGVRLNRRDSSALPW
ncbi:MAG TPA: hypothetical protein PKH18_12210, partial [Ottowia sp.]|nr:hypothetical protein [Ottowia sp.]